MKCLLHRLPLLLLAACGSATPTHLSVESGLARSYELPADWRTLSVPEFERTAAEFEAQSLEPAALDELTTALSTGDLTSVRAAVLLARSKDPQAKARFLARLEERILERTREGDAGDVIAAAALLRWELSDSELNRLERLVASDAPHPDVEVRVEIACSLLRRGRKSAIPFLLTVLREGTLEQAESVDWERKPQMAWSKSRAAETLSEVAGVKCVYQEDGAFHEQALEAARLEALLLE